MYHYCNKVLLKSVPKGQWKKKNKKTKKNRKSYPLRWDSYTLLVHLGLETEIEK